MEAVLQNGSEEVLDSAVGDVWGNDMMEGIVLWRANVSVVLRDSALRYCSTPRETMPGDEVEGNGTYYSGFMVAGGGARSFMYSF